MNVVVSISQFRQNIASYIEKAKKGDTVILKDEKKDQQVVQLVGKKKFDPDAFGKALKAASGVFSAKNHPEWRTKNDVINWVSQTRKASERNF
jgi:antitoxin (DNA-binding transcriptional repressor) of toxin-antitoxin stability system